MPREQHRPSGFGLLWRLGPSLPVLVATFESGDFDQETGSALNMFWLRSPICKTAVAAANKGWLS
jgi:hypothetical protein